MKDYSELAKHLVALLGVVKPCFGFETRFDPDRQGCPNSSPVLTELNVGQQLV